MHGLEQPEGAYNVSLYEIFWPTDGTVDVAFGRKVDDRARFVLGQQALYQRSVVEVDHRLIAARDPVEDEVTANEAGAASY